MQFGFNRLLATRLASTPGVRELVPAKTSSSTSSLNLATATLRADLSLLESASKLRPAVLTKFHPSTAVPSKTPPGLSEAALAMVAKVAQAASIPSEFSRTVRELFLVLPPASIPVDISDDFPLLRLLNLVPGRASTIWASPTRLLWRIWEEDFLNVEVAHVPDTPKSAADRAHANSVLYDTDGAPSAKLSSYFECQSKYGEKLDDLAVCPDDDIDKRASIVAALEAIEEQWLLMGNRLAIDEAIETLSRLGRLSPISQFAAAREHIENLIDRRTDVETHIEYPAMHLLPALNELAWAPFSHSADEVQSLAAGVNQMYPEVSQGEIFHQLFSTSKGEPVSVDNIRGELAFVGIDRPWLNRELLACRAWRQRAGAELFSDGGSPAKGKLPCYAVGAVLARNLNLAGRRAVSTASTSWVVQPSSFIVRGTNQSVRFDTGHSSMELTPEKQVGATNMGQVESKTEDVRVLGFLFESVSLAPNPDPKLFQ